ncbi:MFS transporter [Neolewinella aurantiaca]|uniref:MFS transporter n=1 Tax=Neolewinella aurantiaca TaxID=2602767 RepID=A0A5C7FFI9_9BACT|nr:MFS transporter [Neolewinella aurantiaca]TXF89976.1 MFS transporter [Neolewinella aurantiaca]
MTILQLIRTHPRYLSYGFLHFFFSSVGQTFFISLFVVSVTARMGWEEGTFAALYSGATLAAAFTLPSIGTQVDRLRIRYVSTTVAVLLILACIAIASTANVYVFIVALFFVRLGGQGVMTLIGSTVTGRYFTQGRGKALSAAILGISLAEVTIPSLAVYVMSQYGYGPVWMGMAALLLVVFIPAVWLLIPRYDNFQRGDTVAEEQAKADPAAAGLTSWTRGEVLRDRRFQLLIPVFIFLPFVFTGLVFNQSVIAELRGYTAELMAIGLSTYGASRVVFLLGAGGISDRYGPANLLPLAYGPLLLGLVCLLFIKGSASVLIFFALGGMTAGTESVLMPALWAERYGPRFLGSIKSTVRLLVVLASAAAPIVFSYGFRLGLETWLSILVIYGVLCLVLLWFERRVL